ncbi:MAG: cysteine desulfurase [Armatimonadetes bacterium]|nr:cysteine desulfurase [Armatimonadota bacterium]MDE2206672.1 cysteine desulfurase [Armatimonadota bacterium]
MSRSPIYLDNHATTPVDARVLEAMLPWFTEHFGNAASKTHSFGLRASVAVSQARRQIAQLLGAADPSEIIFTSGATESDNLAIKGAVRAMRPGRDHVVTVATEHRAVLDSCATLQREGSELTVLKPRPDGILSLDDLEATLTPTTALVSVMHANNEIGVIQPIAAIGQLCRRRGVLFHTDAAQSAGKLPLNVQEDCVDFCAFTAHKIYGPKGVAALYVRADCGVRPAPQMDGGGHEDGYRSGTLNVPGIVGLAAALKLACDERETEAVRLTALRNRLWHGLLEVCPQAVLNGDLDRRLPGNLNIIVPEAASSRLGPFNTRVAVSGGSACSSGKKGSSHVLKAIGVSDEAGVGAIRFGLGRFTTADDVEYAVAEFAAALRQSGN